MSEKVRVGIVGAGGNTKAKHLPGFQAIDGVSVDVVCNRSETSSRAVADAFSIPRVAGHWKELVEDSEIDAICIGTWPYLHAPIAISALRAGKHVLTEARMAMNAREAQEMLKVARSNPDLVAQVVPSPFTLKWDETIRGIIESGEIGKVREVRFNKSLPVNADPNSPMNWRQDSEYSGNNTMMLGIYYEPIQRWLREEPTRVMAHGSVFTESRLNDENGKHQNVEIPETISLIGEYKSGIRLVGQMSGLELGAGADEFVLCGSLGTLRLDLNRGVLLRTLVGDSESVVEIRDEDVATWNVEADFIQSIREKAAVSLTSFEQGLDYMKFTDAVSTSVKQDSAWIAV